MQGWVFPVVAASVVGENGCWLGHNRFAGNVASDRNLHPCSLFLENDSMFRSLVLCVLLSANLLVLSGCGKGVATPGANAPQVSGGDDGGGPPGGSGKQGRLPKGPK
jgi:hypothetical protein